MENTTVGLFDNVVKPLVESGVVLRGIVKDFGLEFMLKRVSPNDSTVQIYYDEKCTGAFDFEHFKDYAATKFEEAEKFTNAALLDNCNYFGLESGIPLKGLFLLHVNRLGDSYRNIAECYKPVMNKVHHGFDGYLD